MFDKLHQLVQKIDCFRLCLVILHVSDIPTCLVHKRRLCIGVECLVFMKIFFSIYIKRKRKEEKNRVKLVLLWIKVTIYCLSYSTLIIYVAFVGAR